MDSFFPLITETIIIKTAFCIFSGYLCPMIIKTEEICKVANTFSQHCRIIFYKVLIMRAVDFLSLSGVIWLVSRIFQHCMFIYQTSPVTSAQINVVLLEVTFSPSVI